MYLVPVTLDDFVIKNTGVTKCNSVTANCCQVTSVVSRHVLVTLGYGWLQLKV